MRAKFNKIKLISWIALTALLVGLILETGSADIHCDEGALKNGFVCSKNAATNAVKLCQWVDGIAEKAMVKQRISETSLKCESPNLKCQVTFDVHYTQYASVRPEFEVDKDLVIGYQHQVDLQFNSLASISGDKFQCLVKPGYQAELWLEAPLRRYKGNVDYKSTIATGETTCGRGIIKVDSPLVKANGQLEGHLECKLKPVADITKVVIYVNTQKITLPDETAAVKLATSKLVDILPPMNEGMAQSAIVNGVEAWANGRCYNQNDPKTYHATCGACLRYLSDNILTRAGYARGARWLTNDCFLRYEFYEVDAFSLDDIPDEFP